jgi:hypothetical protein
MSNFYFSFQQKADDDIVLDVTPLIKTNIILSFISLFGSLTIICLFIFGKKIRNFVFNLVFYLSISETLNSIGNIMSIHKLYKSCNFNSRICDLQAVIINYTDFCSLTWMCIISYTIYDLMINYNQDFSRKKSVFLTVGFGLPFVFTIVQIIIYYSGHNYHPISQEKIHECWCWLFDMNDNWVAVLVFYIFYWFFIIGNFYVIWQVVKVLKSCVDETDVFCRRIKIMVYKLYMYPLVSALCFVFATIHRMYQIFYIARTDDDNIPTEAYRLEVILYLLHGMFNSSRGFMFFVLYGCDEKGKWEMKCIIVKVFRFVFKKEPEWLSLENYEESP